MSKTDKTNPFRVKVSYRSEYLVESHDHRFRECTLGPRPDAGSDLIGWNRYQRGSCSWVGSDAFYASDDARCGCQMCSDQVGRKAKARRERQEGRRQARNWREEY